MGNGAGKKSLIKSYNENISVNKDPEADAFLKEIISFDDAYSKLPRAVFYLRQFKKLDTMDAHQFLFFVRQYSGPLRTTTSEQRFKWVKRLLDEDLIAFCLRFWRSMFNARLFTKRGEGEMRNFRMLIGIVWNCTEISPDCCRSFCDNDGVPTMLSTMNADSVSPTKLEKDKGNINRMFVAHSTGAILRSVMYLYPNSKPLFRQAGGVKICQKFLTCSLDILKCTTAMCLAYAVNEEEFDLLASTDELLVFLLRLFSECATDETKHVARLYPFSATEMLDAINKLAANDENKVRLVKLGILETLTKFIARPLDDDELRLTIKCLWILSFREENKLQIVANSTIMSNLTSSAEQVSNKEVSNNAKASLFVLKDLSTNLNEGDVEAADEDEDLDDVPLAEDISVASISKLQKFDKHMSKPSSSMSPTLQMPPIKASHGEKKRKKSTSRRTKEKSRGSSNQGGGHHIMLSYQWNYKNIVLRISDKLKSAGHKVWMDVDQMTGSTLDAMAGAVENAKLVLICMSESYKQSPSCRTEAEYTYKMRKPFIPIQMESGYKPTGWLGLLIGTKLYFNMSSDDLVSSNATQLLREISSIFSTEEISTIIIHPDKSVPDISTASNIFEWKESDVQKWLKDNALSDISVALANFDGQLLMALRKMYYKAPMIYYSTLKSDLKIDDLRTLLKFTNALENL